MRDIHVGIFRMHTIQQSGEPDVMRREAVLKLREDLLRKILATNNLGTLEKAMNLLSPQPSDAIPLCIFANDIFSLNECIVKFLHENRSWSFTKIAQVTAKSPKTVWQTYQNAQKKSEGPLNGRGQEGLFLPLSVLTDESRSTMEIVVAYLKDEADMEFRTIATMLHRDYPTIWTTYKRAKEKR